MKYQLLVLHMMVGLSIQFEIQSSTACENHDLHIECEIGQVINVIGARYGRSSLSICTDGPGVTESSLGCHSDTSYQVVMDRCNGNIRCTVAASNAIFGDPCVGHYKYLEVDFVCEQTGIQSAIACEKSNLYIECVFGKVIKVIRASYGRSSLSICPDGPGVTESSLGCHSDTSYQVVMDRCNGNRWCWVYAHNEDFFNAIYGDPCVGHYKYLEVDFVCEQPAYQNATACENHDLHIECEIGQVINVIEASYGSNQVAGCHSDTSYQVLMERCNGNRWCAVAASSAIFGDPCVGHSKYLEVDFVCEQPANQSSIACENHDLHIECNVDQVINVIQASYGRSAFNICPDGPGVTESSLGCHSDTSNQVLMKRCNGNRRCTVAASNAIFGDPCVGHYKYLEVDFVCKQSDLYAVNFPYIGGRARATDTEPGFPPSLAFDKGAYHGMPQYRFWHSGSSIVPTSLWYEFPEKIRVEKYSFRSRTDATYLVPEDGPSKYIFWASNSDDCSDESQWDKLYEDNTGTPFDLDNSPKIVLIQNNNFYRCYGFKVTDVPGRSRTSIWAKAGEKRVTISDVLFYSTRVPILVNEQDGPNADGSYSFNFETGEGISVQEQGIPTASRAVAKKGTYSLTYPDGTNGVFKWRADEKGFRVESPLLPTQPPIPPHSQAQIDAAEQT